MKQHMLQSMPVKVRDYEIRPLTAPLKRTFGVSGGEHRTLDNLLLRVCVNKGIGGLGEAAVATHMTGETVSGTRKALLAAGKILSNRPFENMKALSEYLHHHFPKNKTAIAAVEMAALDALACQQGIPLWKCFGTRHRTLRTDMTVVIGTAEEARSWARLWYQKGFRTFKIKIGRDKSLDTARILAVAKAAPRARILLDANQAFTPREIILLIRELKAHQVEAELIEQPVVRENLEGLKEVWMKTGVPVCADESASSLEDCRKLIQKKMVPAINIKLMKFGLVRAAEVHSLAMKAGLKMMMGQMMESVLGSLAAAHLCVGLGNISWIDLDASFYVQGAWGKSVFLSPGGVYRLSKTRPGIGVRGT